MHFVRSAGVLLFWLLAAVAVAAAGYQVRAEASDVLESWPHITKAPEVSSGEASPSDREAASLDPPLDRFLSAGNRVVAWLILAAVFLANATLLGLVNVLDHG
jgi:hypothetical protein